MGWKSSRATAAIPRALRHSDVSPRPGDIPKPCALSRRRGVQRTRPPRAAPVRTGAVLYRTLKSSRYARENRRVARVTRVLAQPLTSRSPCCRATVREPSWQRLHRDTYRAAHNRVQQLIPRLQPSSESNSVAAIAATCPPADAPKTPMRSARIPTPPRAIAAAGPPGARPAAGRVPDLREPVLEREGRNAEGAGSAPRRRPRWRSRAGHIRRPDRQSQPFRSPCRAAAAARSASVAARCRRGRLPGAPRRRLASRRELLPARG